MNSVPAERTLWPYQVRVVAELLELEGKLRRLARFLGPESPWPTVPPEELRLLHDQHATMRQLADTLAARIRSWPPAPRRTVVFVEGLSEIEAALYARVVPAAPGPQVGAQS